MNLKYREARPSDLPFLKKMLYEAVFWGTGDDKPSFEEGLTYPGVSNALTDWGQRDGDTTVIAAKDFVPVGAAWYRYWTEENNTRGYYDAQVPVLVIGVTGEYRHRGIGREMIEWLIAYAKKRGVEKISLMVSKDNYAIYLYRKCGFTEYADKGDSVIMVREV